MFIEHIAIWTNDLERLKRFYESHFQVQTGIKYVNESKNLKSYFLSFSSGARVEIMTAPGVSNTKILSGYAHIAISVGSKEQVRAITDRIRESGYQVISEPRHTGDGYFESAILDPDGNTIEITV